MTKTLYRLAYHSLAAPPPGADVAAELRRVLGVSRENNARAGITGALLFNRGAFAQILEGEYAAVERVFETIQNDERHTAVTALWFEPVAERGFGRWSMAHVGTSPEGIGLDLGLNLGLNLGAGLDGYDGVGVAAAFDPASCSGPEIFDTLHRVLLTEEKTWSAA